MKVIICKNKIGKRYCNTIMEKMIKVERDKNFPIHGYKGTTIAKNKIHSKEYVYVCKACGNQIFIEER